MPQSEVAANLWHHEEEERDTNQHTQNKQSHENADQHSLLFSLNEVIAKLKGLKNTMTKYKARLNINRLVELITKLHRVREHRDYYRRMVRWIHYRMWRGSGRDFKHIQSANFTLGPDTTLNTIPSGMKWASIFPRGGQKGATCSITLPAKRDSLNFLGGEEPARFYCLGWVFVSASS